MGKRHLPCKSDFAVFPDEANVGVVNIAVQQNRITVLDDGREAALRHFLGKHLQECRIADADHSATRKGVKILEIVTLPYLVSVVAAKARKLLAKFCQRFQQHRNVSHSSGRQAKEVIYPHNRTRMTPGASFG